MQNSRESILIRAYASYGMHYRTIAKRLYSNGNKRYKPSARQIGRIGRIARLNGVSSLDWRNGKNMQSRSLMNSIKKSKISKRGNTKIKIKALNK